MAEGLADGLADGRAVGANDCVVPTPVTGLTADGGFVGGWAIALGSGEGLGEMGGSEADGLTEAPAVPVDVDG